MGRASQKTASPDFGTLLRRYRLEAGLSQETLADRARLSLHGISALERGYRRTPQRETLGLLAEALALNADQRRIFEAAVVRTRAPRRRESPPPASGAWKYRNKFDTAVTLARFIGREDELDEIAALLSEHRLVTVIGAGGVGKTQTALRAATEYHAAAEVPVCFASLAAVDDPSLVPAAIAAAVGVQKARNDPLLDTLSAFLRKSSLLLLLDNCEHVIAAVANIAESLLQGCPDVRILATSREPLKCAGEWTYRLPSLNGTDGVALFADRAQAADARFTLTRKCRPIVTAICDRLSGIPLAIELAAARITRLPLNDLAAQLGDRFAVLADGRQVTPARQQTMHAALEWSYDLLSEPERCFLRHLAIFVGGWTLEAAQAVCSDDMLGAPDPIDLIASLIDKSLIVADLNEKPRYRLLEMTRAYALEKLDAHGEREALAREHAEGAADLGDRSYRAYWTEPPVQWRSRYEHDFENVRAAVAWSLLHREVTLAARAFGGFVGFYQDRVGETGVKELQEVLLGGLDPVTHPALTARAWDLLSATSVGIGKIEAAQRALELAERCGDEIVMARSLSRIASGLWQTGRTPEAEQFLARAVRIVEGDSLVRSIVRADVLHNAAIFACYAGRMVESRNLFDEALAVASAFGSAKFAASIRLNAAEFEFQMGNVARALELASAVEAEERGPGFNRSLVHALESCAAYRIVLGDTANARTGARDALQLARGVWQMATTRTLQCLATIAAVGGDARRGALLCGYVDAAFSKDNYTRGPSEQRTCDILLAALHENLSDAEIEALAEEGARLSEDQAVAEALNV